MLEEHKRTELCVSCVVMKHSSQIIEPAALLCWCQMVDMHDWQPQGDMDFGN